MRKITRLIVRLRDFYESYSRSIKVTTGVNHICYFGFVFAQGHGFYTYFAGVLCLHAIVHLLVQDVD